MAMLVLTVIYHKQADEQTRQFLKKSISTSYSLSTSRNTVTMSWDLVMANMECCGVNNYTDFRGARLFVKKSREDGLGTMVR